MLRRTIRKREDLTFVIIYTREPHARQMAFKDIHQPSDWKERQALAKKTRKDFGLAKALFVIDEMGDPSRKLFGDVPNPAIFVDRRGRVHEKLSWADASEVARVLKDWKPAKIDKAKQPARKDEVDKKPAEKKTLRDSSPTPKKE